tara:strand:+ start:15469 stop:15966 length:498 start_codon:yes stop_codon:yes gene_type:complete
MKALFITLKELKRKSIFDGNLDADKIIQFIEVAQDTEIQTYLGTKLYNKLQADIIANTLSGNYKTLVDEYVKPMLIWYTQAAYIPYAAYQISNGGIYKHNSENATSVDLDEINSIASHATETAEFYTQRFMDHMNYNSSLYPEYISNQDDGMYPERDVNFTGWVL